MLVWYYSDCGMTEDDEEPEEEDGETAVEDKPSATTYH